MILKTTLLPHEQTAFDKLKGTCVAGLFMDMGTGKTRTAIELIAARESVIDKVVYFCPVSLKMTIWRELEKHIDKPSKTFWNIIGIESMSRSVKTISKVRSLITENTFVVCDESSFIKNFQAERTRHIIDVSKKARYRLILTGTPIQKHYPDLFAQLYFLSPKILGYNSYYSFKANHLEYSEKYPGMLLRAHNTKYLAVKMEPYIYQITQDECLKLPDKIYLQRYFLMSYKQRQLYNDTKEKILDIEQYDIIPDYIIYQLFTALQTIVSGFLHFGDKEIITDNERIDLLETTIDEISDEEQIVIWCKYRYDIDQITKKLGRENCSVFSGDLNEKKRNEELNRFAKGETRFFVSIASCGGFGLNELVCSAYVIYYNTDFNYAIRKQSEDRNMRIGQKRKVTYIDLICNRSIDERIQANLDGKGDIIRDFRARMKGAKTKEGMKKLLKPL
jgi:SNF2 family DNA or RNA helicase